MEGCSQGLHHCTLQQPGRVQAPLEVIQKTPDKGGRKLHIDICLVVAVRKFMPTMSFGKQLPKIMHLRSPNWLKTWNKPQEMQRGWRHATLISCSLQGMTAKGTLSVIVNFCERSVVLYKSSLLFMKQWPKWPAEYKYVQNCHSN